jgi:hypothetical protein
MRDAFIEAAGVGAATIALVHSYLGEAAIFKEARIEPARLRRLLRLVWHSGAVGWLAFAALLIATPHLGSEVARQSVVAASAVTYGFAAIANAYATRGRHFGWAALLAVVMLAFAGM